MVSLVPDESPAVHIVECMEAKKLASKPEIIFIEPSNYIMLALISSGWN